jgi:flagellar biosynthetic protein FliP
MPVFFARFAPLCLLTLVGLSFGVWTGSVSAADLPPVTVAQVGEDSISVPLQILALMTALSVLPALLLAMTAFTRIIVVFGLLRQALGTGQTPSNQVLLGLALFLTMLVMMPVGEKAWAEGMAPYLDGQIDFSRRGR